MANLSRVKTWNAGEILTHSALNAEFDNILNNASTLVSTITALSVSNDPAVIIISNSDVSINDTDQIGRLDFQSYVGDGTGSGSTQNINARIRVIADDVTGASEDATVDFQGIVAGTLTTMFSYGANIMTIQPDLEAASAILRLVSDQNDDAGDGWEFKVTNGGVLTLGNDIASAGSYVAHLTMTPNSTLASSIVAFPGLTTFAADSTFTGDILSNASASTSLGSASAELSNVFIADDSFINLGNDQDVLIGYNTTRAGLDIKATEGAALAVFLSADEGDDAGDEWKLNVADAGVITLGNDIASAGTHVTHLTFTPHATVTSSTAAFGGIVTANAFQGDITGNVTGNASGTALTVTQAAQTAITSVGTLTALQVDNININGNAITSTAGTDLTISPVSGQQIVLDGAIVVDAGVVTGATSITSTAFVGDITGDVTGTSDVATVATTVTITDNESTDESNAIIFTAGGDIDGGNLGLESDGDLTYNPSTGKVTATGFVGALTGNVTGNASGTALTVTQAAQTAITSVGTLTGLALSGTFTLDKGADVASTAGVMTLGADGNYFDITGTNSITGIATLGVGTEVTLHFDAAAVLVHDGTNFALPGAANITCAAGDEFTFVEYASADWRCVSYALASGSAIVGGSAGLKLLSTQTISGNAASVVFTGLSSTYDHYMIFMDNVTGETDGAFLWGRASDDSGSSFEADAADYHYAYTQVISNGSLYTEHAEAADNATKFIFTGSGPGNAAGETLSGQIMLSQHDATGNRLHVSLIGTNWYATAGALVTGRGGGSAFVAAGYDQFQLLMSTGGINGTFSIYGVTK
jgi:hypothetical protein